MQIHSKKKLFMFVIQINSVHLCAATRFDSQEQRRGSGVWPIAPAEQRAKKLHLHVHTHRARGAAHARVLRALLREEKQLCHQRLTLRRRGKDDPGLLLVDR